jgi:hypothetical protein
MIDGPRVVRDLSRFVQESDARGVLLHLNNMENLTEADAQHAANLLRDLRDPLFLQNGLHFVLVGTTDAVTTVVQTHQQVRNTVSILRLDPLSIADVHATQIAPPCRPSNRLPWTCSTRCFKEISAGSSRPSRMASNRSSVSASAMAARCHSPSRSTPSASRSNRGMPPNSPPTWNRRGSNSSPCGGNRIQRAFTHRSRSKTCGS